ncbi:helix-turn-helix domain-containing protein [Vagococcus fluvialis]|uniref:helix-turn-helix domain-containing protein n=1 Tax=Vagococcus fluvialis TaxID=2738 RepID=UPI0022E98F04|nr:helix-turn-helix transcriptional regulator [Vagococcus fluvialis]
MWEFNMGAVIQQKRKEKELTQEELARLMGVSKSSVSKWETGQTYPDIYLLPELATFFNISIDSLMAYKPQLDKFQIRDIYVELSEKFGKEPFDTVFEEYQLIVKKYYASERFLLQMAVLLLNYSSLAKESRHQEILNYIIELTSRVKTESKDPSLMTQANVLEGFCHLQLGNIDETLRILNHDALVYMGQEQLLSQAYAAKGDIKKAQEILQVTQFQHLIGLIVTSGDELIYEIGNIEKFDEIVSRVKALAKTYDLKHLHPFLLITFLNNVFISYTQQYRFEEAINTMKEIVDLMISQIFPVELHGDDYFYLLDDWMIEQPSINTNMPRDEKTVKTSLIEFYVSHPGISTSYKDNKEFNQLLQKLKENCGE